MAPMGRPPGRARMVVLPVCSPFVVRLVRTGRCSRHRLSQWRSSRVSHRVDPPTMGRPFRRVRRAPSYQRGPRRSSRRALLLGESLSLPLMHARTDSPPQQGRSVGRRERPVSRRSRNPVHDRDAPGQRVRVPLTMPATPAPNTAPRASPSSPRSRRTGCLRARASSPSPLVHHRAVRLNSAGGRRPLRLGGRARRGGGQSSRPRA